MPQSVPEQGCTVEIDLRFQQQHVTEVQIGDGGEDRIRACTPVEGNDIHRSDIRHDPDTPNRIVHSADFAQD